MFTGWPPDATEFLTEISDDNTPGFWARHRHRHDAAVSGPTRALAAELEPAFGPDHHVGPADPVAPRPPQVADHGPEPAGCPAG